MCKIILAGLNIFVETFCLSHSFDTLSFCTLRMCVVSPGAQLLEQTARLQSLSETLDRLKVSLVG